MDTEQPIYDPMTGRRTSDAGLVRPGTLDPRD
jgi:hypothetical protein